MPSARGASKVGEIDSGFSSYVVLARDAFEIQIEKRLGHGSLLSRAKPCLIWPAFSPMPDSAPRTFSPTSPRP